jgi:hypothetical protein
MIDQMLKRTQLENRSDSRARPRRAAMKQMSRRRAAILAEQTRSERRNDFSARPGFGRTKPIGKRNDFSTGRDGWNEGERHAREGRFWQNKPDLKIAMISTRPPG